MYLTKTKILSRLKQRCVALLSLVFSSFALVACAAPELTPFERVSQTAQQRYGVGAVAVTRDWHNMIVQIQKEPEQKKLKSVNDFFNRRVRFVDDIKAWGQTDYWATPIESLMKGSGDCEDFAIAKYFSLQFADVPISKLRITYARARMGGPTSDITQAHMVLAYYDTPDAEPLVLDNLVSEIFPASRRSDLAPIFGFNSEGVWQGASKTPQPGGSGRLSKWATFLEKMRGESFE